MVAVDYQCFMYLVCVCVCVLVLDIIDCATSRRSGRHIIPPLAWWTTERILIHPNTNTTHIVCDSPVVVARTPTDKLFYSSYVNGPGKNNFHKVRVKQKLPSELSTHEMENGTDSLASTRK